MKLDRHAISVRRLILTIAVFGMLLAAIRANYQPRLYLVWVKIQVVPLADHNPAAMQAHAQRILSPENLAAASAEAGQPSSQQPFRVGRDDETIGLTLTPTIYATVPSMKLGTISVMADSTSEAEARGMVLAIIRAYIQNQGPARIKVSGRPSTATAGSRLLGTTWELLAAVGLAFLVAMVILFLPLHRIRLGLRQHQSNPF